MSIIFDTKQKLLFKFGNSVCKEERWVHISVQNFSNFLKRLREVLKDDLEIFFYLRFQIHLFLLILLCIRFLHTFVFVKEHVTRKNPGNVTIYFVIEFICKFSTMNVFLMTLLLVSEILLLSLTNFSVGCLFFS